MENSNIAIIGGGFSGTIATIQQILSLTTHNRLLEWSGAPKQRFKISIYEKKSQIGPGEPYQEAGQYGDIFLLNQPAYAMSPFPGQPDHFVNWLRTNGHPYSSDDFVSRGIYGKYLRDIFVQAKQSFEDLGYGKIQHIQTTVSDLTKTKDGSFKIISNATEDDLANAIILAPGHSYSDLLSDYFDHPGYFSAPFDAERANTHLSESGNPALIVGTSQSMLDGLALLDRIKFKGSIIALSRNLVKPWLFDAVAERSVDGDYEFQYLKKDILCKPATLSLDVLKNLFENDLENAKSMDFPTGHILSRFNSAALDACICNPVTKENFKKIATYANALYGNPTSPQRYKLMQDYEERGQLTFVQGDIAKAKVMPLARGFKLQLEGNAPLCISALFNSASYSMKTISDHGFITSPLLDALDKRGALKRHESDKNAFASGEQNWKNLYLIGPSCNSQRWGVGTFRESLSTVPTEFIKAPKVI